MKYTSAGLSGLPLSGKSSLVRRLQQILGWEIYSIGELHRENYRRFYPNEEITFEQYWRNTSLEENLEMNMRLKELMRRGNVIGDSRYLHYCRGFPAFLIFVYADLDKRIERAISSGKYRNKTDEQIRTILIERENDEVEYGEKLFGLNYDYRSNALYDLWLDTTHMTVEEEVEEVMKRIKD